MGLTFPHINILKKKVVMAFGTFDLFHPGHMFYLGEAEKLGTNLIIVIGRDKRVATLKGRYPLYDEKIRRARVEEVFPHALVLLGDEGDIFSPIRQYHPDILAFGYDQFVPEKQIHILFPNIEVRRIASLMPERWKSSILRREKEAENKIYRGLAKKDVV